MPICGIDYGSKLAGTTALATLSPESGNIQIQSSEKKKDADAFLEAALHQIKPDYVFIDAPLSLPLVYRLPIDERKDIENPDFFYRTGDRVVNAMSPLFLGGLTARAMRLVHRLSPTPFYETYPAWQAKRLSLKALHYKKEIKHLPEVQAFITQQYPEWKLPVLKSWHELDAILALVGAWRFSQGIHEVFGEKQEGQIFV